MAKEKPPRWDMRNGCRRHHHYSIGRSVWSRHFTQFTHFTIHTYHVFVCLSCFRSAARRFISSVLAVYVFSVKSVEE